MNPPQDTPRCAPPLLPSTSLGGLEQFVPPGPLLQSTLAQSWRFKPLPQLPGEVSSVYSRGCDEEKHGSTDGNHVVGFRGHSNGPASEQWVNAQQPFFNTQFKLEHSPQSSIQYSGQNKTAGGCDVQVTTTKRPSSYDRTGRWSPFPTQKSPQARAKRNSANSQRAQRDKTRVCSTGDLTHKSLVPAPLVVDGGRLRNPEDPLHPLRAPASADFHQHRSLHPPHHNYGTISGAECSRDRKQRQSPINGPSFGHDIIQERSAHPDRNESQISFRDENSHFPSRKELYSFCTNSTARPNKYTDGNDAGYDNGDIENNGFGEETCYSPLSGYPFTPDSPAYSPSTGPFIQRPKQLAIPPTEYQKHGPQIWSSQNKQYRAGLFPRCVRQFLPRSWKPREDHKGKDDKKKKQKQEREMEKILSNIVLSSPHGSQPPPPRPPRPPTSSSPAAPASPSLPHLTFPEKLNASDYFYDTSSTTDADYSTRLAPTSRWNGLAASSSAASLSRRVEDPWRNHAVHGEAEMEIRRARSEAVLGTGPITTIVDRAGNYWL